MSPLWRSEKHQQGKMSDESVEKLVPKWKRLSSLVRRGSGKAGSSASSLRQGRPSDGRPLETSVSTPHLLTVHNNHANGKINNSRPLLDINFEQLRTYRLSDGWLDDDSPPPPPPPPKDDTPTRAKRLSATPIADLYSKSTDQLATAVQIIGRKPVLPKPEPEPQPEPEIEPEPETPIPAPTCQIRKQASTASNQRGRTLRTAADTNSSQPQPIRISLRDSSVGYDLPAPAADHNTAPPRRQNVRSSWAGASINAQPTVDATWNAVSSSLPANSATKQQPVRQLGFLRSIGTNTTGMRVSASGGSDTGGLDSAQKRHSMPSPTEMQYSAMVRQNDSLTSRTSTPTASTPLPTQRPSLSLPSSDDARRRTWQMPASPAPTNSSTSSQRRSISGSRPPSTALTAGRLAWIRELEGGRKNKTSDKALKDIGGGVASKLAMFEQKKQQNQQQQQQPSLSKPSAPCRSNSTASRMSRISSSVVGSGTHEDDVPTTTRTSMESSRSTAAPVMAYYDEAFREKMEGLTQAVKKRISGDDDETSGPKQNGLKEKVSMVKVQLSGGKTITEDREVPEPEKAREQVPEQATEQAVEQAVEQATEQATKQAAEQATEQALKQAADHVGEPVGVQEVEPVVEEAELQSGDQATERVVEQVVKQMIEQVVHQIEKRAEEQGVQVQVFEQTAE